MLANQNDFKLFNSFEILSPNEFSDHCAIYFNLGCTHTLLSHDQTGNHCEPILAWENTCAILFREDLNKQLPLLGNLATCLQKNSTTIDDSVDSFASLSWDTAFKYFGKSRFIKKNARIKVQKKPWFNAESFFTRKENRTCFIDKKHVNVQMIRRNKSKFKLSEGKRISSLAKTDPKSFWKNIKSTFRNNSESNKYND